MTNPTAIPAKAFYGCIPHKVGTAEVNARWSQPVVQTEVLLGMCYCCGGPALIWGFDELGIGWTDGVCTACEPAP